MDNAQQEKIEAEIKTRGPALEHSERSGKHSENRMANKQRKKRAHRRKLKRSHTNG